jgi:hypothetical protein
VHELGLDEVRPRIAERISLVRPTSRRRALAGSRSHLRRWRPSRTSTAARGAGAGRTAGGCARPAAPDSLEGALAAQLADGAITQEQYRRAMEFVAARDAERDPLSTLPEDS